MLFSIIMLVIVIGGQVYYSTVKPAIKDTLKEDKPPSKGQAESNLDTHSIKNHL